MVPKAVRVQGEGNEVAGRRQRLSPARINTRACACAELTKVDQARGASGAERRVHSAEDEYVGLRDDDQPGIYHIDIRDEVDARAGYDLRTCRHTMRGGLK
jgi:hypothetical protein